MSHEEQSASHQWYLWKRSVAIKGMQSYIHTLPREPLLAAGEDVVFRLTYLVLRLEQVMGNVLILCDKACDFSLSPICMFVLDSS